VSDIEKVIEAIELKMKRFNQQSWKCTREGQHQWATVYTGRVLGLCDARNICKEELEKAKGTVNG
jgi:hypothetical protein